MGSCQRWAAFGQAVQQSGAQHPSAEVGAARSRSVSTTALWLPRSSKSHPLCLAPTQGWRKSSLGCTPSRWCSPHQEGEEVCSCRKWGIFVMMEVEKCRGSGLYWCCLHSPPAIASGLSPALLLHLAWSLCLVAAFAFFPGLFVMSGSFLNPSWMKMQFPQLLPGWGSTQAPLQVTLNWVCGAQHLSATWASPGQFIYHSYFHTVANHWWIQDTQENAEEKTTCFVSLKI